MFTVVFPQRSELLPVGQGFLSEGLSEFVGGYDVDLDCDVAAAQCSVLYPDPFLPFQYVGRELTGLSLQPRLLVSGIRVRGPPKRKTPSGLRAHRQELVETLVKRLMKKHFIAVLM